MVTTKRMNHAEHNNARVRSFIEEKEKNYVQKVEQHNLHNLMVGNEGDQDMEDMDLE